MKAFLFIPDFNKKSGLGHIYRCFKYSYFVKKNYKVFFLIKNKYKNYVTKIKFTKKIKFLFFSDLRSFIKQFATKYKHFSVFIDSYNFKIHNINFKKFSKKHIVVLDHKIKTAADIIINHTFGISKKFHDNLNKNKVSVGLKNFPIIKKLKKDKKNIILINFGSTNDILLIKKTLIFLTKLKLNKNFKIVIISKSFSIKNTNNLSIKNKIMLFKHTNNINRIYQKTIFSFGACGISLYEKSFFKIPTVAVCAANNQIYNFKNFYLRGCIMNFYKIIAEINKIDKKIFFKEINKIKMKLNKYFIIKKNIQHINYIFESIK
jgi:spore coat polysaccharide biosynthesis predicted glycosyltransferase SpsG